MLIVMGVGQRIRQFRLQRRLTIQQLAERAGIDPSYLSRIEKEQRTPDLKIIFNIADALQIPITALFEESEVEPRKFPRPVKSVPLFDTEVSAGNGAFPEAFQPIDDIQVDRSDVDYAFVVHGSSMEPILVDGDIVFVKAMPATEVRNGDMIVAIYDNRFFVKWIRFSENRVFLISENPEYEIIVVSPHERFEVIGKVVEVKREITRKRFRKG